MGADDVSGSKSRESADAEHRGGGLYIYCAAARILRGSRNFVSFPFERLLLALV